MRVVKRRAAARSRRSISNAVNPTSRATRFASCRWTVSERRVRVRYLISAITISVRRGVESAPPLFAFLSEIEDVTLEVLSFLGREEVAEYRECDVY